MVKCRVPKCTEGHSVHFCKLCKDRDSNHFSSECPEGKILYHGTHMEAVYPISEDGLNKSADGRLGKGIYFVEKLEEAKKISANRKGSDGFHCFFPVVLKCRVNLGKTIDLNYEDCKEWQRIHWYDSAVGMHPPWCKINHYFREYCLKNGSRCIVTAIIINDKMIVKGENKTWSEVKNVPHEMTLPFERQFRPSYGDRWTCLSEGHIYRNQEGIQVEFV